MAESPKTAQHYIDLLQNKVGVKEALNVLNGYTSPKQNRGDAVLIGDGLVDAPNGMGVQLTEALIGRVMDVTESASINDTISAFQESQKITQTGKLDRDTLDALDTALGSNKTGFLDLTQHDLLEGRKQEYHYLAYETTATGAGLNGILRTLDNAYEKDITYAQTKEVLMAMWEDPENPELTYTMYEETPLPKAHFNKDVLKINREHIVSKSAHKDTSDNKSWQEEMKSEIHGMMPSETIDNGNRSNLPITEYIEKYQQNFSGEAFHVESSRFAAGELYMVNIEDVAVNENEGQLRDYNQERVLDMLGSQSENPAHDALSQQADQVAFAATRAINPFAQKDVGAILAERSFIDANATQIERPQPAEHPSTQTPQTEQPETSTPGFMSTVGGILSTVLNFIKSIPEFIGNIDWSDIGSSISSRFSSLNGETLGVFGDIGGELKEARKETFAPESAASITPDITAQLDGIAPVTSIAYNPAEDITLPNNAAIDQAIAQEQASAALRQ